VVFFSNKTDSHDITEILLKVALNTIHCNPIPIPNPSDFEHKNTMTYVCDNLQPEVHYGLQQCIFNVSILNMLSILFCGTEIS
jgi:hypothetical protein